MARRYLPVKAAALATAGLLLIGGGPASAAPDSDKDRGGGKPSSAGSGKAPGNNGAGQGSNGGGPGNSGSNPGNGGTGPGKPATTPGGNSPGSAQSGPKNLPDTASPVAGAATAKTKPAASGTPNAFGKSVSAAASGQHGQGSSVDVETPSVTSLPTSAPAATVTVPVNTTTPVAATPPAGRDSVRTPARADGDGAAPTAPEPRAEKPSAAVPPELTRQSRETASTSAPAAAALSLSPPRSAGETSGITLASETASSWIGRVASQVADEVRAALREVTLKDLALAALPGLAGILFCLATGIGLGHRQARFGFALESSGALRFSVRGPIGVVRPGGFISLPRRTGTPRSPGRRRSTAETLDRAA